jgi:hypothetical protein
LIHMNGELTAKSLLEQLQFEGIDYESRSLLRQVKNTWLLLDDAQNAMDPKFDPFWQFVVKTVAGAGVEDELKVVIATTYNVSTLESPSTDFCGLEHIYVPMSQEEATTLVAMHTEGWGYHKWQVFRETLLNLGQCTEEEEPRGYHIGVIMAGIRMLADLRKPSPATMTEDRALLALRKEHFTGSLDRCFKLPSDHLLHEQFKSRLLGVVTGDHQEDDIFVDDPSLCYAIRAGLLTQGGRFSNMAAMWYYNRRCFPHRATKAPERLDDLIMTALRLMSSKGLRETQVQGFPSAAALYYLFNEALSLALPLHEGIIPELNTVVDNPPANSNGTGTIDFYVPGKLKWCLELLRHGDKIGEHGKHSNPISTGHCRKAEMNDYIVVDCRGPMEGEGYQPSESRCTLYFSEDYQFCWCQMRMEPLLRIELAN